MRLIFDLMLFTYESLIKALSCLGNTNAIFYLVDIELTLLYSVFSCVYGSEETPVPISNTEVKLSSGDGTAVLTVGE